MSRKHRKFKDFFRPKLGDLQKKKKKKKKKRSSPKFRVIFRPKSEIQTFFRPKSGDLQKKKKKKKKKVFAIIQSDFSPKFRKFKRLRGALFVWGGLFSIFHRKSASKAQNTCVFANFPSQWGGLEPPPPPPWLRYCCHTSGRCWEVHGILPLVIYFANK